MDRDLAKLDKRIALLIKNRTTLQEVLAATKKIRQKKKGEGQETHDYLSDQKRLENYQDLFYLLQTEPKYLARCLYLVNSQQMDSFLDTTILTLYGDAFSPREEYLLLKLFQLSIEHEMQKVKQVDNFLEAETVVPKMIITYNRRKQGIEYLRKTLSPVVHQLMAEKDLNLELMPMIVYQTMLSDYEIETGNKSELPRNITEEEALQNADVKKILASRIKKLDEFCQIVVDSILSSLNDVPYGLRWVCKQLRELCEKRLPDATPEELFKLTIYFVYYRFINLAIVTPDAYKIVDKELNPTVRKNLVVVAKVLQNLFNFRKYDAPEQKHMFPLNDFIERNKPKIINYFNDLIRVDDPEDHLKVNKYMELTQKTKPVILISLNEIFRTHQLLHEDLDTIAPDAEDPLRKILQDLGKPPSAGEIPNDEDDREIQLTLTNRFKVDMEEESEMQRLYAETKELVIPILRLVPLQSSIQRLNLMDVLEAGIKYAAETNNKVLSNQINTILENMGKLEKEDMLSKHDNYESFVHDVAMEVANRKAIREQQRKEIVRLNHTLDNLRKHQAFINEQIDAYTQYLNDCREKHYKPAGKKKKKVKAGEANKIGPFTFTYKELQKKGLLIDSEVPHTARRKTKFMISSETPGVFDIVAKVAGVNVEKMQLEFDDLLERHYNNITKLELDQVTLDVNMTIHLLNKFFMKAQK